MEFKTRRLVNDYLEPPEGVTAKMNSASAGSAEIREDLSLLCARDPHELHRALEMQTILDCADMAAAASLYRTESRWGFYHLRVDYPETDDAEWACHTVLFRTSRAAWPTPSGQIDPYIAPSPPRRWALTTSSASRRRSLPNKSAPQSRPIHADHHACQQRRRRHSMTRNASPKKDVASVSMCAPLDILAIDETRQKAYMKYDECWYCMPCEVDCPTNAVKVNIPYLLR